MHFLITGGNGFIGSALAAELTRRDMKVRATVRTSFGLPKDVEECAIGDIGVGTDWTHTLKDIDVVIHLAARVHVMSDVAVDPLAEFLKVNLHGTMSLARQAAQADVKRFVYISSIGVNGNRTNGEQAFSEANSPCPHNDYSRSKWLAEQALWAIAVETDLEVVVVRPPLIYGPAAKGNFPKLLTAIAKGIPLPLAGASNVRSLMYVGNLVDALITCSTHPSAGGQTYLVCDGDDISTASLARKMAGALDRKCRSFYFPTKLLRVGAAMLGRSEQVDQLFGSLCVNDEKIRSDLGWVPPYELEQGLIATADWYCRHSDR